MSAPATMRRPIGVLIVAFLTVVAAFWNLTIGFIAIIATFGDNPTMNDVYGVSHTIPTFSLLMYGAMSIFLGLIYFWLTRMTLIGSATAHTIISIFMVINIVFGFFRLPFGWFAIFVSLIILLMVNTKSATEWFKQNP